MYSPWVKVVHYYHFIDQNVKTFARSSTPIIFTIFFMGGTTACMLKLLGIETGVAKKTEDEIESDMEEMHASAHPTLLKVHNCLKTVLLRPEVVLWPERAW